MDMHLLSSTGASSYAMYKRVVMLGSNDYVLYSAQTEAVLIVKSL